MANRIAIATADGVSVADHLARSAAFIVVDLETGAREARDRGTDACGNHRSFVDLAAGCRAVICGGVGQGAVNALAARGTASAAAVATAITRFFMTPPLA